MDDHRPVRVYLDTSDYSRFADLERRPDGDLAEVLAYLRERTADGSIEVRFSAIHLFEFLKDPSQRALALRKVKILEELCGERTFRSVGDVFRRESETLAEEPGIAADVSSDVGEWFPETDVTLDREEIIRRLLESFPSIKRRQLEAMLRKREAAAHLRMELQKALPLWRVYDSDLLERFLVGRVGAAEMAQSLARGFARPSVLIAHYLEGSQNAIKFFGALIAMEQKIQTSLLKWREVARELVRVELAAGRDISDVRRQIKATLPTFAPEYLRLKDLPVNLQETLLQGHFALELPGMSIHCSLVRAYLREVVYPANAMPELKESDAADILHATYLPYTDLYRTDGRFAALLRGLPAPTKDSIVAKARDLPVAIEKTLSTKRAARAVAKVPGGKPP
jgi:hypothetical protein